MLGVYCRAHAVLAALLDFALQSVDFLFCRVRCHNFIAFGHYTFPFWFTILNRFGFLY